MTAEDEAHNRRALAEVFTVLREHFVAVVVMAHESITVGSPLTGAPGQPVDTGNLRNSWGFEFDNPSDPQGAVIGTPVEYAQPIEDGVGRFGPLTLRSSVGGWHSVKLTVANFDRILAAVKERFGGRAP